ncbi:MAG: hypothetical protein EOP10_13250 [Proteobacteria bacterium]|nr:MAG: hypothetical protein EOP10_13250 [Pseudomonadota bacterium]
MNRRPGQGQAPTPPEQKGRPRRRRRGNPSAERGRSEAEVVKKSPPTLKKYGVVFYENHALAKDDALKLAEMKAEFDQLNIIVKAEGSMDDPELVAHGRVYAGEAWHLIHRRRVDDGWYNDMHE